MIGAGRCYAVTLVNVSMGTASSEDLFYIKPAADKPCVIEAIYLSNVGGTADAGDAQEELLRLEVIRLTATVTAGTGGNASPNVNQTLDNDTNASFTARTNDAVTTATGGASETLHADGFNVRVPYVWLPPPEHRFIIANAQAVVVRLNTAPADALTLNGTCLVREWP